MNYRKDIYEKVKFMLKENPEANINCSKLARIYGCDRRTVSKNIDAVKNNIPPPKTNRTKKKLTALKVLLRKKSKPVHLLLPFAIT